MAIIVKPNSFSAGTPIIADEHNENDNTIYADYNGNITNANISGSAAIAYSKLNLATSIVNADVSASAAIAGSKLNLVSPGAVGTTTPAAGKFTTLEATTTLKLATTNQGDILYDNGTSLVRLTPGTSGQALLTQGAGANPIWGAAGSLKYISKTVVTAAANSGNISIPSSTKSYLVKLIGTASGSGAAMSVTFNGVTANYQYVYSGTASASSASASAITLTGNVNDTFSMEMTLSPIGGANYYTKSSIGCFSGGSIGRFECYGYAVLGGTISTMNIAVTGVVSYTGDVYLYEYQQS